MLHIQTISTLDLPELQPYRTLRRHDEHRREQIFVAEGELTIRRLLETSFILASVLLTPEWLTIFRPLLQSRAENIHVFVAEKPVLEKLIGFSMFQGLMAVAKIPTAPTLEEILSQSPKPSLFVATDGVSNAENLGTLVRNSAAFSVDALFISQSSSSPFLRRAVRSSMGGIFNIPVLEDLDLVQTLGELRKRNVHCVAAHPRAGATILPAANLQNSCCIVFGNEAHGVSEAVVAACDEAVAVPMTTGIASLNVSSAGSIFLYEVRRQRNNFDPS